MAGVVVSVVLMVCSSAGSCPVGDVVHPVQQLLSLQLFPGTISAAVGNRDRAGSDS
jgi:hypothetical protein